MEAISLISPHHSPSCLLVTLIYPASSSRHKNMVFFFFDRNIHNNNFIKVSPFLALLWQELLLSLTLRKSLSCAHCLQKTNHLNNFFILHTSKWRSRMVEFAISTVKSIMLDARINIYEITTRFTWDKYAYGNSVKPSVNYNPHRSRSMVIKLNYVIYALCALSYQTSSHALFSPS